MYSFGRAPAPFRPTPRREAAARIPARPQKTTKPGAPAEERVRPRVLTAPPSGGRGEGAAMCVAYCASVNSTRRLATRPLAVLFDSIGCSSPRPFASSRLASTPFLTR